MAPGGQRVRRGPNSRRSQPAQDLTKVRDKSFSAIAGILKGAVHVQSFTTALADTFPKTAISKVWIELFPGNHVCNRAQGHEPNLVVCQVTGHSSQARPCP
jgi:hypothetical protein